MKAKSSLTREELQCLLTWLDPDPHQAAGQFEVIRRGLIERFLNQGCVDPEALADETIDRVAKKLPEIGLTYEGERKRYFHGVAKRVSLEYLRQRRVESRQPPPQAEPRFDEIYYDCLEECLAQLETEKRDLILRYYAEQKSGRIEGRKQIRRDLMLEASALRVRTHRIRRALEKCVADCVGNGTA